MPNGSKISCFLSQLITMNRDYQHEAIKELSTTFIRSSLEDLKIFLRFLVSIDDYELELKLFALLAASITNNAAHYEFIVLYEPLYDKLSYILNRGLSLKSTVILNFMTALVYTNDESTSSRTQLTLHSKNMLRVSGCLRLLATFFMDTMMFPDTWKYLCQCVAECCREMKLNCDHCAHLIPVCIQKCFQGLLDAITVLNSLLDHNEKNIKTFIRSNGIKIFTRDNLQSTACLQLLCAVVQNSPEAVLYIRNNEFREEISQILEWSGPYSPNGQWCAIILYYINDRKPIATVLPSKPRLNEDHQVTDRTSELFEHIMSNQKDVINEELHKDVKGGNDTTKLFRNIMNEIQFCKTKDEGVKKNLIENRIKPNPIRYQSTSTLNPNDTTEDHFVENQTSKLIEHKNSNEKGINNILSKDGIDGNDTNKLLKNIMNEIQFRNTQDDNVKNNMSENRTKTNHFRYQITPRLVSHNKNEHEPAAKKYNIPEHTALNQKRKNNKLYSDGTGGSDTTKLLKNIMNEIQLRKTKDVRGEINRFLTENRTKANRIRNIEISPSINCNDKKVPKLPVRSPNLGNFNFKNEFVDFPEREDDMTFSFLKHGHNLDSRSNSMGAYEKYQSDVPLPRVTMAEKSCQVEPHFTNTKSTYCDNFFDNIDNFAPAITSTPKNRNKAISHSNYSTPTCMPNLKMQTIKRTTTTETIKRSTTCLQANHNKLIEKRKLRKAQKKSPVVNNLTKRSMSSRFLDAVNESCTTIIKSVKDLFMTKQKTLEIDNNVQPISSGHSFMHYMRQRDMNNATALYNNNNVMDFSLNVKEHGCTTCDDTAMLKKKMQTDENLKRTIKKLKAGINMYGCNFKKISKVLWPHERYMTPTVLYNLYRKLILK